MRSLLLTLLLYLLCCSNAQAEFDDTALSELDRLVNDDPVVASKKARDQLESIDAEHSPQMWFKVASRLILAYARLEKLEEANKVLQAALALNPMAPMTSERALIHLDQVQILILSGNINEAAAVLVPFLHADTRNLEPFLIARAYSLMAIVQARKGDTSATLEAASQAMEWQLRIPLTDRSLMLLHSLSIAFISLGELYIERAIPILLEMESFTETHKRRFMGHIVAYNLGDSYFMINNFELSASSYDKAASIAFALKDPLSQAYAQLGLGSVYRKNGKYLQAQKTLVPALHIFQSFASKVPTLDTLRELARTEIQLGQLNRAKLYLQEADTLQGNDELSQMHADLQEAWATYFEASGDHKKALSLFRTYLEFIRQKSFEEAKNSTQRFNALFDVHKKQRDNELLSQANQIQEYQIERQIRESRWKNILIIGALGALSGLSFFALGLHRKNQEINRLNRYIKSHVLRRYLHPHLVEEIVAGRSRLDDTAHHQTITVIFADLCEFTKLTEELGAEAIAVMLNEFFVSMTEIIFQQQGTVDKFIGDAIMVLFGAPTPMSPDEQAEKAIASARRMFQALEDLNIKWRSRFGVSIEMRIGMHQGRAVVGNFGGEQRSDYTAVGPAVNIASRIEVIASPGTVLLTESLMRYLKPESYRPIGLRNLRGIAQPIEVAELILNSELELKEPA